MSAGITGGYGEKRGSSSTNFGYDAPTYFGREQAYSWLQNPTHMPGFYTGFGEGISSAEKPDLGLTNDIIGDLRGMGTELTPTEQSGIDEFRKSTNLASLLDAQKSNFGAIVSPKIRNALASMGMGRSGAEAEAIALAGNEATVPLTQLANQRQAELGQLLTGSGAGAAERFLRALLGGGQLALGGALGSAREANSLKAQQLAARTQLFTNLLNFLQPLETRRTGKTKGSEWNVAGNVSAGFGGGPTGALV